MNIETTFKTIGIGTGLVSALVIGAWALWPDATKDHEPRVLASVGRASDDRDDEAKVARATVRRASERLAARAEPSDAAEPDAKEDSPFVETDVTSLGQSRFVEETYDHAYVYTGPVSSKEEQNAKKGIFTEATLRAREDELIRTNPEMKAGIEAERLERETERERYARSGGLTVEQEAIQNGVQLEN